MRRHLLLALAVVVAACSPARAPVAREPVTGMSFVLVPPGRFVMGSPADEPGRAADETLHRVVLPRGFWLGRTEVTRAQWERVMGAGERHPEKPNPFRTADPRCPVVSVSHDDVREFLRRLETMNPGQRFRLPSEAEWEYACRAGSATSFSVGNQLTDAQANVDARIAHAGAAPGKWRARPVAVGSYAPNAWGLYDMHGNAWEWTADDYAPYAAGPATDPHASARGAGKVIRGGSWAFPAARARSAARQAHAPGDWGYSVGFRVVWER